MTTQQMNYMMYQQARQSAMRAFVAMAAGGDEPVSKRRVSLKARNEHTHTPYQTEVRLQECSEQGVPVPGGETSGTGSVETNADAGSWVRAQVPAVFEQGDYTYCVTGFTVNGTYTPYSRIPGLAVAWTDVQPGSDPVEIFAEYLQLT